jgi:trehalose-6-phosphate synthase
MSQATLTIVSNRLPITLAADGTIKKSSGGLVSALEGIQPENFRNVRWLGWPGGDVSSQHDSEALAARLEREQHCTPVFLDDALARDHYDGLSNSSLWPLLHSMPSMFQYRAEWWDAYQRVNQHFADRVLETTSGSAGGIVWVHDYQLMLVPWLIKRVRPSLRIGFFLHTPFPSSDVFRCHPNREMLLTGCWGRT